MNAMYTDVAKRLKTLSDDAHERYKAIEFCYVKLWAWGLEGGSIEHSMEADVWNWSGDMLAKVGVK